MLLNGISIQGGYHEKNQDSFACRNVDGAYVAAVSDGLGSKKTSEIGSRALCESACEIVSGHRYEMEGMTPASFAEMVHQRWLEKMEPHQISDCYATMLLLLVLPGKILATRLGDGFVSVWADGETRVLFDRKEDHFANETDCLTEEFAIEKLECLEMPYTRFHGGILCSDGVEIGNMTDLEIASFTRDFIGEYRSYPEEKLLSEVSGWLKDWTGTDDKTLAFVLTEEQG